MKKDRDLLRIFTSQQVADLSQSTLKTLRSEILLHFQLTDEPTTELNGHHVDKNTVLEIFDGLKVDLLKYLKVHFDTVVDSYLTSGSTAQLIDLYGPLIMNAILKNPVQRKSLINQTSNIIFDIISVSSDDRKERIQKLGQLTKTLPVDLEQEVYAKSLRYLRSELESIKTRFQNPFLDNHSLELEPELRALVDVRFIELFLSLPSFFHFLAYEYALWCQEFVLETITYREAAWSAYPIDSLLTIRDAALVAGQYYDEYKNIEIAQGVSLLLNNPAKLAKNWKRKKAQQNRKKKIMQNRGLLIVAAVVVIIWLIRFLLLFG